MSTATGLVDLALEGGVVECVGALDADRTADGFTPRRLPAWTRPQIPELFMHAMITMGSGVRLAFTTDTDVIEVDVKCTGFRTTDRPARPPAFQVVLDHDLAGARTVAATTYDCFVLDTADPLHVGFEPGEPTTVRFDGLGVHTKHVEIWLPHAASTELRALRIAAGATATASPTGERRRWVHYGSSISHCMEADTPTETWPAVAAGLADVELFSLGLAGQCLLDPFVARTIRDLPADVISLKLGINVVNGDAMRERVFVPAVHGLLDTIRDGHPDTPILVVSPIYCPSAEDRPGPTLLGTDGRFFTVDGLPEIRSGSLTLRRIRELLGEIVATRRALGDTNLAYLDGLQLFGPDDAGDLPDDLHPSNAGYARMGRRFADAAFGPGGPLA